MAERSKTSADGVPCEAGPAAEPAIAAAVPPEPAQPRARKRSAAKAAPPLAPLSDKHRAFVAHYVVDFNATQAAIRAGYAPHSARVQGSRVLRRPDVAAAVKAAIDERRRRTLITADQVLQEYARIAFADLRRVSRWGPKGVEIRDASELSDDAAAAIAEISGGTGRATRIKLHDKRRALDSIARHLGLFEPRPVASDPKARHATAERVRAALAERLAALAGDEPTLE